MAYGPYTSVERAKEVARDLSRNNQPIRYYVTSDKSGIIVVSEKELTYELWYDATYSVRVSDTL